MKVLLYSNQCEEKFNEFKGIFDTEEKAIESYIEDANNDLSKRSKEVGDFISVEKINTSYAYQIFYNYGNNKGRNSRGFLDVEDTELNEIY